MFRLGAVNWQADAETLPLFYAFEYLQRDSAQSRFVQGASQASVVSAMLPPGSEANANVWALKLRISNIVGSETVATTCNMHAGDCLVTVTPMAFASADAMLEDLSGRSSAVQELINAGDSNAAINYVSILLQNVNSANVGARRISWQSTTLLWPPTSAVLLLHSCTGHCLLGDFSATHLREPSLGTASRAPFCCFR